MSATLSEHDGRSMVRIERRLAHPQENVWRAVTKPDELRHWFPATVAYDQNVGAPMAFTFADNHEPSMTGEVVELDPPRIFAFLWEGELLRIELQADGPTGCLLVFTHHFDDRPGAASFATGWTFCLDAMERSLAGSPGAAPSGWEGMHELHETYVAAFGLDQGTIEELPDGWQVRYERQLTRPVADVWASLTGSTVCRLAVGGPTPSAFIANGLEAGVLTALTAPTLIEYEWVRDGSPRGLVRWAFSDGPGGAARLVLAQTGPRDLPEQRALAFEAWHTHIERLTKQRQAAAR